MVANARSLDCLFRPRSIAVIGASRRRGTVGGEIFHNLIAREFPGPVYPVNPTARVVQAVRAYPSIADVPDEVDLAVIVVSAEQVLEVAEACGKKGVKGLVVISAGFAEVGPAGRARQDALRDAVRRHGMRMVGPNCLGLMNIDPSCEVNATFAPTWPPHGNVAFSSQSGALGLAILDLARELGVGISQFVSVGNKADLSGNDLLEYWEQDPNTHVILLYLESFGNPHRFVQIARRVARRKPIVAVKSGRTEAGARAASSHTGALAGLDVAVDALLLQSGVIRTNTIEELFDVAMLLANQPVPRGNRVAILTNAGGPGIMATDACETNDLVLPALSPHTVDELKRFLPPEASLRNPVDMIATASADSYERAISLLIQDPQIDAILVLFVPPIVTEASAVATAILRAGAAAKKPILTCFLGTHGIPQGVSSLRAGRFPSYAFPEAGAIALARAVRYGRWLTRPEGRLPAFSGIDVDAVREITSRPTPERGRWLTADEVRAVLAAYGIRAPHTQLAATEEEACAAAREIGFPVALKLASPTITHKSEVGGVLIDLVSELEIKAGFSSIRGRLRELGRLAEMSGVVVQEMARPGVEVFAGVTLDPEFGPLLGFGIGGVNVELWRDVAFRVHPITDLDAQDMMEQIRGKKLLDGFRGSPPADRAAIVDVLLRVSQLVGDFPQVAELDINPLVAYPPGGGVIAVDARIRVIPERKAVTSAASPTIKSRDSRPTEGSTASG